ncbi:MAG: ABC transporter ATP-binding protein [Acidobacteriaceae bacterium]|nr:ABC transporter ATP-binding protein [Acidobacteriaceae bacterium]
MVAADPEAGSGPLLQVRDLTVRFRLSPTPAVDGVALDVRRGETIGILGPSGCGKTTLARSLIRLLPPDAQIASGSIRFQGKELLRCTDRELRAVRGAQISIIFQEPELALNPVISAGKQIEEVLRAHTAETAKRRRDRAQAALADVGLPNPQIYHAYAHELSGGQRQRVSIAQALCCRPALLVADEPTSALDAVLQAEFLDLLKELRRRLELAVIFITHNPALLVEFAHRVIVMNNGRIVETGRLEQIYTNPQSSCTKELLRSVPQAPLCLVYAK